MSDLASRIRKARAFFLRDMRTDLSYRGTQLLEVANVLATVASFYFLSKTMGDRVTGGYQTFPFLLLGMAVNGYLSTALYCFSQGIRGGQKLGVMKAVLGTPISSGEFLLYSSVYPICRAAIDGLFYLAGGALLGLSLSRANLTATVVLFALSVAAHAGIGIISATFALVFKKGDPLVWIFGGLSWMLGGVFYSPEVLPEWMRWAAQLFPMSHALRGTRAAMLDGAPLGQLLPEMFSLSVFVVLTLPFGVWLFQRGLKWARQSGSLGHS